LNKVEQVINDGDNLEIPMEYSNSIKKFIAFVRKDLEDVKKKLN